MSLDDVIEDLELDAMTETEIKRVVSSLSREGMDMRKARKQVRYKLYRIQTEINGGAASGVDGDFKTQFESDPLFGGWRFFGVNWDVSMDDPYRCVHREKSVTQEWNELIEAKYPTVEPGGKVVYPDIKVREKIEANSKKKRK